MTKIIVTGGAGFIGSNFIIYMLNKYPNYKITCFDALTYAGNINNLLSANKYRNFQFIKGDITDAKQVDNILVSEKPDIVVNFAAESHVDKSINIPLLFSNTNYIGTHTLLEACRRFKIKRFHQVSTDEVYGDLPIHRTDLKFDESYSLNPSSPYSASKAAADLLCNAYFRTYSMPITISRCSNNYGPYHFPEKLIPLSIINALNNQSIPLYGTGENVRDWLYVNDHCAAIDLIIHKGTIGEVYNVGGNNEFSNIEVVNIILEKLGKPSSLIGFVNDRPGHDQRYAINSTKIKNELNWKVSCNFEEGITKTISWYLDNRNWWEEILNGNYSKRNFMN